MAENTAALIQSLLKSGRISADTRQDLEEFERALAAGELEAADARYVDALARRVLGSDEEGVAEPEAEDDEGAWGALEARAEAAEARVRELEAEKAGLLERIDQLEGELATLKNPDGL